MHQAVAAGAAVTQVMAVDQEGAVVEGKDDQMEQLWVAEWVVEHY